MIDSMKNIIDSFSSDNMEKRNDPNKELDETIFSFSFLTKIPIILFFIMNSQKLFCLHDYYHKTKRTRDRHSLCYLKYI